MPDRNEKPLSDTGGGFLLRTGKWFCSILVVLLLSLALTEVVLRAIGVASPVLYTDDEATGYRLRPEQSVRYIANRIIVNRWGVRDPRSFDAKDPATKRIVVLGDSVTWGGFRMRQENLFTSVLERSIPHAEVINAGVNGYSAGQMARLYRNHLIGLSPDLVLVYAIPRDFVRPVKVALVRDSASFPKHTPMFALSTALEGARMELFRRTHWKILEPLPVTSADNPEVPREQAVHANIQELTALKAQLPPSTRLLVVLAPVLPGSTADGPLDEIKSVLTSAQIKYVNLAETVKAEPSMFVDGVHYSINGHARVAAGLAKIL